MTVMLEVAIAMALIFLLLSILVSALQEAIAALFNRRGRMLEEALIDLLAGQRGPGRVGYDTTWQWMGQVALHLLLIVGRLFRITRRRDLSGASLEGAVLSHGLIVSLGRGERLPAYVPPSQFVDAVVDVLRTRALEAQASPDGIALAVQGLTPGPAKEALRAIVANADGDIARIRAGLSTWFETAMDRTSGWYKRETQYVQLTLGLLVAIAFNVDAIFLASTVANDEALRASLVRQAEQLVKVESPGKDPATLTDHQEKIEEIQKKITALSLPIGWPGRNMVARSTEPAITSANAGGRETQGSQEPAASGATTPSFNAQPPAVQSLGARTSAAAIVPIDPTVDTRPNAASQNPPGTGAKGKDEKRKGEAAASQWSGWAWLLAALGWVVTAVAISLGSPIWFDLLNRVLRLRAAGVRPEALASATRDADATGLAQGAAQVATATVGPIGPADDFEKYLLSPDDIRLVQRALGVAENARLDRATRERVRSFQRASARPVDGLLTPDLVRAIRGIHP